jgi:hypothetical protein
MSRPRTIDVQHAVLTTLVRQHAAHPVFDLLEVRYDVTVPADTEFPRTIPKFDFYLRIVARAAGPTRLRIRVRRRNHQGTWERVNEYVPNRPLPFPRDRTVVHSQPVRLPHVKLTGTGLYAIKVYFRPPGERWSVGAVEYFRVVRAT